MRASRRAAELCALLRCGCQPVTTSGLVFLRQGVMILTQVAYAWRTMGLFSNCIGSCQAGWVPWLVQGGISLASIWALHLGFSSIRDIFLALLLMYLCLPAVSPLSCVPHMDVCIMPVLLTGKLSMRSVKLLKSCPVESWRG